jgi:signal transduction histidine kinase/ketosteroid isomerase-like protein
MTHNPNKDREILELYDKWLYAYLNADIETYKSYLDEDYHFIGSTNNEEFLNKEETTRFFVATADQLNGKTDIRNNKRTVEYFEGLAFITEVLDAYFLSDDSWHYYGRFRFSSVLQKKPAGWRFIYQHFSTPDSKAQEGETIAFEKVSEENRMLREAIKRRTIELEYKNRELEIETSLERVRSRSLAMQKSEELQEVIKIVYQQLIQLHIKLDHAGFVVDYAQGRDWHFWIADEQDIPSKITHPYFESVWAKQFDDAKNNGQNFFTTHLDFEEKNKFYQELLSYVQGLEQTSKDFYLTCPGLAASTVLFDHVGLYIENFSGTPYTDAENAIILRFGKVFDQAYTRFLDLQKAEAQAREAEIQLALERVRARTMAMYHSNELNEVAFVLFEQIRLLGGELWGTGFVLCDTGEGEDEFWFANEMGVMPPVSIPHTIDPVHKAMYAGWQNKMDYLLSQKEGEELSLHYHYLNSLPAVKAFFEPMLAAGFQFPNWQQWHAAYFASGYLLFITTKPYTEPGIFKRFASVFEQTYTRFLDLQKAEAQAREARIEAALEKVRSRTMAMQKSDELLDVATIMFQQVKELGVPQWDCGFSIWEIGGTECTYYPGNPEGIISRHPYKMPLGEHPVSRIYEESRKRGDELFIYEKTGEIQRSHYRYMLSLPGIGDLLQSMLDAGFQFPEYQIDHVVNFAYGNLIFITYQHFPEMHDVFKRLAKVFEQTYTRFLDLQKAEAQAREAQIELSLEKIRAQVTSMRESANLLDIMVNIRSEFVSLGHEAHYFWYMRWLADKYEKAMTSGDGTQVGMIMTLPRHIHGDIPLVARWEQSDESTLIFPMDVDTAVEYVHKMITLGDFEQVDPQAPTLEDIRHIGGLTFIMARTSQGEIGYSLPGCVPNPPEEAVNTLARFAGVFDLAYKRFEDFKKAEGDLVEIKSAKQKAEDALAELKAAQAQLIQSEKMASLGELTAGIAHEIQNPLNFVNNFSDINTELSDEIVEASRKGDLEEIIQLAADIKSNQVKISEHGKRADAIVKGMLQHSRSSSGIKEPTDINKLADEYFRLAFHGLRAKDKSFNATLHTDFDPAIGMIPIMSQDIGRVLLNLINNAFYAVNEKQKEAHPDYEPGVWLQTKRIDEKIELSVRDNGNGIPDKIKEKIFQPFFTTKPTGQGTGLGLSLSYDIVKAHGGELKVETLSAEAAALAGKEGEGSEFVIQLPVL